MIGTLFALGALLGVRHALEADHVAAVASLASRARSAREVAVVSAAWGFGHALALILLGSLVIALGTTISAQASRVLEMAGGLTLIALGADVLFRLRRNRVHAHPHRHPDGTVHLHVHRHDETIDPAHHPARHSHDHPSVARAIVVGGIHGLAGSAALVLLAAQATDSFWAAAAYLTAFGFGSIVGMVAFSLAISVPMVRLSAQRVERSAARLEAALGCATIAVGAWVVLHAASA